MVINLYGIIHKCSVDVKSCSKNDINIISISLTDKLGNPTYAMSQADFYGVQNYFHSTPIMYFIRKDIMWNDVISNPNNKIELNTGYGESEYYRILFDFLRTKWSFL